MRVSGSPKLAASVDAIGSNFVVVTTTAGRPAFSSSIVSCTL